MFISYLKPEKLTQMFSKSTKFHVWASYKVMVTILPWLLLPPSARADFTRTPDQKTYVEEGADVEFLWIVSGSSVINEVEFGIGSSARSLPTFLIVRPGNNVTILPFIPNEFRGRLTFTGDIQTRTIRFQLSQAKVLDGNKFFGCNVYVTPPGSSTVQLPWKPTFLQVVVPPQISSSSFSSPLDVIEGNDVIVNCSATGKPAPNVTWTNSISNVKLNQSISSALLVIKNLRRGSDNNFICTANSMGNFSEAKGLQLNVVYKPELRNQIGSWDHNNLTLNCGVTSFPAASVTWFGPDEREITTNVINTSDGSRLTVTTSSQADYGQYVCQASNKIGNTDQIIMVNRWSIPGLPRNLRILEKETNYTRISWTAPDNDGGSAVIDYKVKIQQNTSDAVAIVIPEVFATEKLIGQLIAGSTYRVWVYARNIVGYSKPVDTEFTTQHEERRKQEHKLAASSYGENLDAVYWSIIVILAVLNILQLFYNIWIRRKMKEMEEEKRLLMGERTYNFVSKQENLEDDEEPVKTSSPSVKESDIALVQMEQSWEVSRDQVSLLKIIGKGAFGQVAKAKVKDVPNMKEGGTVAVKMLKENAAATDKKDLLSELEVMKRLKPHRHVIKLLGCVTETDPLMVIIEYVPYGDLLGYLRKSRGLNDTYYKDPDIKPKSNLTSQQLIKFSWQIADGMAYLSDKKIIHRDLAARNVLVGEGETCKVTDFGMARDVQQEDIYTKTSKGRLPVKWTSYESLLYGKYTTQSDVWSYGVLLFEIFTIGGCPYPGMKGHRIAQLLQDGYRMPRPQHVQQTLYQMMLDCWQENPDARPTFPSLRGILEGMEKNHVMYVNLKDYNSQLYESLDDLHGAQ